VAGTAREVRTARNWYRWLWVSPAFTIPTLILLYLGDFGWEFRQLLCPDRGCGYFREIRAAMDLLFSGFWHLILLIPSIEPRSAFVRWHARQALLLAGIRTAVPVLLVLAVGIGMGLPLALLLLLVLWVIGPLWGRRQAAQGQCSLANWLGQPLAGTAAMAGLKAATQMEVDPGPLVDVIRFSRDPQERKAALAKLDSLGLVERLDQQPAQAPTLGPASAAESDRPTPKKNRGYLWLLILGVVLFFWAIGRVSEGLRQRSITAAAQARATDSANSVDWQRLRSGQLVSEGESLARSGDIDGALARYKQARDLYPGVPISAQSWNVLCWWGSLYGHASEVMYACEFGVAIEPENGGIRDSRGLARALTGDFDGAIQDFQFFVESAGADSRRQALADKRQRWIGDLELGINPFDAQTLEALKHE